jgi:predicted small secreted protein
MRGYKTSVISKIMVIVLAMALVLTACNNSEAGKDADSSESTSGTVQKKDMEQVISTASENDGNTGENTAGRDESCEPTEQIINADVFSGLAQIKNTVIELPCTVQELLDAGFSLTSKDMTENYLVDAGDMIHISLGMAATAA